MLLEWVCSCRNSKLESGCQQHSNNRSSMVRILVSYVMYIHELRKKSRMESQEYLSVHCFLCSNQLFDLFLCFTIDKLNMVNDIPEYNAIACLNLVSSWRCGLWSTYNSSYSLQVLGQSCYFPSLGRLVD
jgi:hypothetical protein